MQVGPVLNNATGLSSSQSQWKSRSLFNLTMRAHKAADRLQKRGACPEDNQRMKGGGRYGLTRADVQDKQKVLQLGTVGQTVGEQV